MEELKKIIQDAIDSGDFSKLQDHVKDDPALLQKMMALSEERDPVIRLIEEKLGQSFDILIGTIAASEGIRQTKYGERALAKLKKPTVSPGFREDPALARAISQANRFYTSPASSGIMEPFRQQLAEGHATGLEQARTASGGQAGVLGAQNQALYNRRLSGAAQMPAALAQIQAQYGDQYAGLLDMQARNKLWDSRNQIARDQLKFGQYNTEAQAYGDLASQGRINQALGLQAALGGLAPMIAPSFRKQPMSTFRNTGIQEIDDYGNEVNASINNRFYPQDNRFYTQGLIDQY